MNTTLQWIINGTLVVAVIILFVLYSSKESGQEPTAHPSIENAQELPERPLLEEEQEDTQEPEELEMSEVENDNDASTTSAASKGIEGTAVYVDIAKLDEEYNFIVDARAKLDKRATDLERRLELRRKTLETKAMEAQQKLQAGELGEEEALTLQNELMAEQQQFYQYADEQSQSIMVEREELNRQMLSNVSTYLEDYAKRNDLQLVFAYDQGGVGGILYADPSLNVTGEVIKGLNKKYMR